MKHQRRPIIIYKRKKAHGHHGGAWKIAYADFMTAMMAFFLVMWLLSSTSASNRQRVAEYFRLPLKTAITQGDRNSASTSPIPGGGEDVLHSEGEVQKKIKAPVLTKRDDYQRLQRLHERLDQLIAKDPRLQALKPHLLIQLIDQGLRIQIIDSENRPMFETGSAQIQPYMHDILQAIAPILAALPNKLSLSGHTDDQPYVNGDLGYSNWELSSDRANASRRELIKGGVMPDKILRVVGMADTMSLKGSNIDNAINRRISIIVLNLQEETRIQGENKQSLPSIRNENISTKHITTALPAIMAVDPAVSPVGRAQHDLHPQTTQ